MCGILSLMQLMKLKVGTHVGLAVSFLVAMVSLYTLLVLPRLERLSGSVGYGSFAMFLLESFAVIAAVWTWESFFRGGLSFCVSLTMRLSFARSFSGSLNRLSFEFPKHLVCWESHAMCPWFERVASSANIADVPSRNDCALLRREPKDEILFDACVEGF